MKRTELGATAGIMLRREALDMGYDDRSIAAMVKSRRWVKVRHGSYVDARVWSPLGAEDRHRVTARAVLKTARSPVVLSHLSAAVEWGADVWDVDLSEVHLNRLDGKCGRREAASLSSAGRSTRRRSRCTTVYACSTPPERRWTSRRCATSSTGW